MHIESHPHKSESALQPTVSLEALRQEIAKVVVGHDDIITFLIIAVLSGGHVLLEGVPGVAKTTMVKAISAVLGLQFKRIQFTPDLLPSDLIGTIIYNQKTQEFNTKKGPIFANLILADEINRAPAKVQAALLEAMQEQQVTIGSTTYHLDKPFLVFATQNPLEHEGTYRLPEAQIDRFMFKLLIDYPSITQEKTILQKTIDFNDIQCVLSANDISEQQKLVNTVYVDEKIIDYLARIIFTLRMPAHYGLPELQPFLSSGVSSRAGLALFKASQVYAFLKGRYFVTPDDVKAVAQACLRHRLTTTYEAEARGMSADMIITTILQKVSCP